MRKGIFLILFVFVGLYVDAQETVSFTDCEMRPITDEADTPFAGNDIPVLDENGNLVVPYGCSDSAFAAFLNTSPFIAEKILNKKKEQAVGKNRIVFYADSCQAVGHIIPAGEAKLGGIGKIVYRKLGDNLSRTLFLNYWTGGGDIELSDECFLWILLCIKELNLEDSSASSLDAHTPRCPQRTVSFYKTRYQAAFGVATIIYDSEKRIVGFSDTYDFDAKKIGVRPLKYELYVRMMSCLSSPSASNYNIHYGCRMNFVDE